MLQQAALVGEGEVEGQVARVLPEAHLAQKLSHAGLVHAWSSHVLLGLPHLQVKRMRESLLACTWCTWDA